MKIYQQLFELSFWQLENSYQNSTSIRGGGEISFPFHHAELKKVITTTRNPKVITIFICLTETDQNTRHISGTVSFNTMETNTTLNRTIPWLVLCNTNSRQYTANRLFKLILIKNTKKHACHILNKILQNIGWQNKMKQTAESIITKTCWSWKKFCHAKMSSWSPLHVTSKFGAQNLFWSQHVQLVNTVQYLKLITLTWHNSEAERMQSIKYWAVDAKLARLNSDHAVSWQWNCEQCLAQIGSTKILVRWRRSAKIQVQTSPRHLILTKLQHIHNYLAV